VATVASAAAVEAEEANIETTGVVLDSSQSRVLSRLFKLNIAFSQLNRSIACSLRGIQTALVPVDEALRLVSSWWWDKKAKRGTHPAH
jgi:hypothetical protein